VTPLRSVKPWVVLALVAIGGFLSWHVRKDIPVTRSAFPQAGSAAHSPVEVAVASPEKPPFDFYLLSLTWHAAFCGDGHGREAECRVPPPRPLVIHGLWPERLEARTYPHDCTAPKLNLEPSQLQVLKDYMPGVASGLHAHEWREHGSCSGLDADAYFEQAILLAREMDAALAARLSTWAGGETSAAQVRAAADAARPGLGATFTLHCRTLRSAPPAQRQRPFLVEIRQCVDNDGPAGQPGTLLDCSKVGRHDQGCGNSFRIANIRP